MKLSPEEIEAQLKAIRQDYLASLADRRDTIAEYCQSLANSWEAETYNAFYRLVHSLAGSAETFGLRDVTSHARHLLNLLKQHDREHTLDSGTFRGFETAVDQLLRSIDASLQEENSHEQPG